MIFIIINNRITLISIRISQNTRTYSTSTNALLRITKPELQSEWNAHSFISYHLFVFFINLYVICIGSYLPSSPLSHTPPQLTRYLFLFNSDRRFPHWIYLPFNFCLFVCASLFSSETILFVPLLFLKHQLFSLWERRSHWYINERGQNEHRSRVLVVNAERFDTN